MDKAIVDLGKSESTAGLTFVCLSRAKRLVRGFPNPVINLPFSFGYKKKCAFEISLGRHSTSAGV